MLAPAGWLGDEPDAPPGLLLLSVARRTDGGGYDVWVCNAGDGLQYHAVRASDRMGSLRVNAPARLPSVSEERAFSAAFWFLLLRPLIWPCEAAASRSAVLFYLSVCGTPPPGPLCSLHRSTDSRDPSSGETSSAQSDSPGAVTPTTSSSHHRLAPSPHPSTDRVHGCGRGRSI